MNNLPKYWIVKNDGSQLFRDTVIKYLDNTYNFKWKGCDEHRYYGWDNNNFYKGTNCHWKHEQFENNPTILSIEEFITLSKEIEDKLYENECDITLEMLLTHSYFRTLSKSELADIINVVSHSEVYSKLEGEFSKQKAKNLINKWKMKTNKEIIGWKLTKLEYESAALKICDFHNSFTLINERYHFVQNSTAYNKLKNAGVLELWFEPLYKEEEEFKIGDIVLLSNSANGYGATTDEICNKILKITKIVPDDRKNLGGRYYFGNGISTVGREIVRKASPEEIKEYENSLLLEEAKKKYPVGITFISAYDNETIEEVVNTDFYWFGKTDIVVNDRQGCSVYSGGKWAEILPSFPQITINGYKGEFFNEYIKFGCAEFDKHSFIYLYESIKEFPTGRTNKYIQSVTIGKGTFSKEQIKEIAEYYLNKK